MSNKDSGRGQNAFEERLAKLEKTVETLSSEEITLEEAVRQYEQGLNDYEACKKILEDFFRRSRAAQARSMRP